MNRKSNPDSLKVKISNPQKKLNKLIDKNIVAECVLLDISDREYPNPKVDLSRVWDLTHLQTLRLDLNEFPELDIRISKLTNLTDLRLDRNLLTTLPDQILALKNLTNLSLNNNRFTFVPDIVFQMTSLKQLHLDNNIRLDFDHKLSFLSPDISKLVNLKELYLGCNALIELPDTITALQKLHMLKVCNNQLLELPAEFGNLTELTHIAIHDNKIVELPTSFANLTGIKFLQMDDSLCKKYDHTTGKDLKEHSLKLIREPPQLTKFDALKLKENQRTKHQLAEQEALAREQEEAEKERQRKQEESEKEKARLQHEEYERIKNRQKEKQVAFQKSSTEEGSAPDSPRTPRSKRSPSSGTPVQKSSTEEGSAPDSPKTPRAKRSPSGTVFKSSTEEGSHTLDVPKSPRAVRSPSSGTVYKSSTEDGSYTLDVPKSPRAVRSPSAGTVYQRSRSSTEDGSALDTPKSPRAVRSPSTSSVSNSGPSGFELPFNRLSSFAQQTNGFSASLAPNGFSKTYSSSNSQEDRSGKPPTLDEWLEGYGFNEKVRSIYLQILDERGYFTLKDLEDAPPTKDDLLRYGFPDDRYFVKFTQLVVGNGEVVQPLTPRTPRSSNGSYSPRPSNDGRYSPRPSSDGRYSPRSGGSSDSYTVHEEATTPRGSSNKRKEGNLFARKVQYPKDFGDKVAESIIVELDDYAAMEKKCAIGYYPVYIRPGNVMSKRVYMFRIVGQEDPLELQINRIPFCIETSDFSAQDKIKCILPIYAGASSSYSENGSSGNHGVLPVIGLMAKKGWRLQCIENVPGKDSKSGSLDFFFTRSHTDSLTEEFACLMLIARKSANSNKLDLDWGDLLTQMTAGGWSIIAMSQTSTHHTKGDTNTGALDTAAYHQADRGVLVILARGGEAPVKPLVDKAIPEKGSSLKYKPTFASSSTQDMIELDSTIVALGIRGYKPLGLQTGVANTEYGEDGVALVQEVSCVKI